MRWNTELHLFRFTGPDESLLAADSRYFEQMIPPIWRLCTWWYYLSILWPRRPRLTWVSGGPRLSGLRHALVRGAGEKPKFKALKTCWNCWNEDVCGSMVHSFFPSVNVLLRWRWLVRHLGSSWIRFVLVLHFNRRKGPSNSRGKLFSVSVIAHGSPEQSRNSWSWCLLMAHRPGNVQYNNLKLLLLVK